MTEQMVFAIIVLVMGICFGFYIAKEVYVSRFWKAEQLFKKYLYKRQGTGEYFSDKIAVHNYSIIFNGMPIKEAEKRIQEPDVVFVITK